MDMNNEARPALEEMEATRDPRRSLYLGQEFIDPDKYPGWALRKRVRNIF